MSWLDRLERRFGFIAVPGLLRYVAFLSALVFVLYKIDRTYLALLDLVPAAVMQGQLWRLVTYVFIPGLGSLLPLPDWFNAAFYVLFILWMGNGLEAAWGSFKLTLFCLLGMIGTTIAAFFFGTAFSNLMLTSSLFFAFARFFPDTVIYVAYLIPVKVKWIAWASALYLLLGFVTGSYSYRAALIAAMANYFIFFGQEIFHQARHRKDVSTRRQRFEVQTRSESEPLHKCATCGATELSNPDRDFRVSRDGEEYCVEHLPSAVAATTAV